MVVCDAYKPVLQEYQEALEENFENMSEYTYVQSTFDPYFTFYRGRIFIMQNMTSAMTDFQNC